MKRTFLLLGSLAVFGLVSCAEQGGATDTSSAASGPGGVGTTTESGVSNVGGAPLGGGVGVNIPGGGH
jgi:hypothetical protein